MYRTLLSAFCLLLNCVPSQSILADDSLTEKKTTQIKRVGASEFQVALRESPDSATFAVLGLTHIARLEKLPEDELQKLFSVRVQRPGLASNPTPLLGTYSVSGNELRFESRFPLSPSVLYGVKLSPRLCGDSTDNQPIHFSSLPKERQLAATVAAVYPSADVLPENVLKFYIHFTAPMSRGEAYKRIHLMHDGKEVESPFLELGEELWDADQKRFTLFFHPGRIKRGLKPREESGTPMVEGSTYRLLVDGNWLGADLQPLSAPFEKKFRVVAADSQQPDPGKWQVTSPALGTHQPVGLTFDEPIDHALLHRVVSVKDGSGVAVHGIATITRNETHWSFVPSEPWKPGKYSIRLEASLEDLAGNNLSRRFETLEQETQDERRSPSEVTIDWVVR